MVEKHMIDVRAFYEQYVTLAGKPSRAWRSGELEYHGPCPWCGGEDRFAFWSSGRYSCSIRASGCGRYGRDVIDFLRDYTGLSFVAACDELGVEPGRVSTTPTRHRLSADEGPPPRLWQERAAAVIQQAQHQLWSQRGQTALAYLKSRGFSDDTIRVAALGYIPCTRDGRWYQDALEHWGLPRHDDAHDGVWLPEGILIPWYADGHLWKLHIRRLGGLKDGDARYVQVKGSREGLYNSDAIQVDVPLVLCESEFDALSGQQACGELAACVATGATTRARRDRWLARMGLATCVLVAYDNDPPDRNGTRSGDAGAAYWVQTLPHAVRWLPWAHDISDMLTAGQDIRAWFELGVAVAASHEHPVPADPSLYGGGSEEAGSGEDRAEGAHTGSGGIPLLLEPVRAAVSLPSAMYAASGDHTVPQASTSVRSPARQGCPAVPLHLPPAPSRGCRFELVAVGRDHRVRAARCRGKALANGWCETHQHAQEVLELGARLGYPRLELTAHRAVGAGKGCWEAYAMRATPRWLRHDLPRMKALVAQGDAP
jgi:DNA primase